MSDNTPTPAAADTRTDAAILSAHIEATTQVKELDGWDYRYPPAPRIVCRDGFMVSVQAGPTHYCQPRAALGPWYMFECGYPSQPVPEWLEYRDGDAPDTENVFGYVPAREIMDVIRAHGGAECLSAEGQS